MSKNGLTKLKPNPRNPRTINDWQRNVLGKSLRKFGDLGGIVFNRRTGRLVGGHQRVRSFESDKSATVELEESLRKPDKVGTVARGYVTASGTKYSYREVDWDGATEAAANIAANQHGGEFVDKDVGAILNQLDGKFDLDVVGFDVRELYQLMAIGEKSFASRLSKYKEVPFSLEDVQRCAVKYFEPYSLDEFRKTLITKTDAMVQFNRLCQGFEDGYWISLHWNPHRLTCVSGIGRKLNTVEAQMSEIWRKMWARGRMANPEKNWFKEIGMGIAGVQIATEFPPYTARDIYCDYLPEDAQARVLDPCHGWGGRLIGAIASGRIAHYEGYDPAPKTNRGVRQMHAFLSSGKRKMSADLHCLPFEQSRLRANSFDFAFTSPPYFNTERYDGGAQSHAKYRQFDAWVEKFYHPLILKTVAALKPGAVFLLNVGNIKFPLAEEARKLSKSKGWRFDEVFNKKFAIGGSGLGRRGEVASEKGESFYEIRK